MTRRGARRGMAAVWLLAVLVAGAFAVAPGPGHAQQAAGETAQEGPAVLIADRVELAGETLLIATGAVEVVQGETRLTASRIVYDDATGRLSVEGPIRVTQGDDSVILASSAEIDRDLRDGILRSARLVLDRQLQLAAVEINRVDGRYNQLSRVTASSCEVCAARPVPLWRIRARRVVHDEQERQIYFDDAFFDVVGVPVFYIPRLRLPDPTLERATGFLVPSLRTTDQLGEGIKVPYFIRLGRSRDLTLTPYVASNRTATLEARYRQAFRTGEIEVNAAVSSDDIRPDDLRSYLFAEGAFALPMDFDLTFDIEAVSDDGYLLDYDYSGKDRLDSAVALTRVRRDAYLGAEFVTYESLRASEDNKTQPFVVGDAAWLRRYRPAWTDGTVDVSLRAHGHERRSGRDRVGRDVGRVTASVDWRADTVGPAGLLLAGRARLFGEATQVGDDSRYRDPVGRVVPAAAVELRWPWSRGPAGPDGAAHLIEPVAQLVWSPGDTAGPETPADESTQLEFDEGNLFALSRFPALDRVEAGLRANLGLSYTRTAPTGWTLGVTVGRIYRTEDLGQFDGYDALDDPRSDWLASVSAGLDERLSITNRALFDEDFTFDRFETRFDWGSADLQLGGSYTWLAPSDIEGRPAATNEWQFDGTWQVTPAWRASADWRYDLREDRSAAAELGVEYRTECVTVTTAVRRRFTSSEAVRPTTDVTFEVALAGFGAGEGRPRPRRPGCLR